MHDIISNLQFSNKAINENIIRYCEFLDLSIQKCTREKYFLKCTTLLCILFEFQFRELYCRVISFHCEICKSKY